MSIEIKDLIEIKDDNTFLFYKLDEETKEIIENEDFFKIDNLILKTGDSYKKIKEISKDKIKLSVPDVDYDTILKMKGSVNLIYEDIGVQKTFEIQIKKVNFEKKEGFNYLFLIETQKDKIPLFIKEIEKTLIEKERLNLILRKEKDD